MSCPSGGVGKYDYFYLTIIIQFNINDLFAYRKMVLNINILL